jgi:asparagine synthase (glutamine-hydrolysing)
MSVQYGRWQFDGRPLEPHQVEKVSALLSSYGPDAKGTYSKDGVSILYHAFYTTTESHREKQPHTSSSGAVITWDGRLDNRAELIDELQGSLRGVSTDVDIVSEAYDRWGTYCFRKLIGDWAISIWNPTSQSLTLAKDPIGTRHLYYLLDANKVIWSSVLDPIVLLADRTLEVCAEFIAGWFGGLPATHLTPYAGIHAVSASHRVVIAPGKHTISKYWEFDSSKSIRYRRDIEYEEHFRTVFANAIRRRLRSDRPVLAELSGGIDSASIVCMADAMTAAGEVDIQRVETISYYDDSNPDLDERAFLGTVEEKRGRVGYHIDLQEKKAEEKRKGRSPKPFLSYFEGPQFAAILEPADNFRQVLIEYYGTYMKSQGYRVTLSGTAGEHATGGFVPSPTPELQDLLVRVRLSRLARQLNAWARRMGKSQIDLLGEAVRGFLRRSLAQPIASQDLRPASWFRSGFVRRNRDAFDGYPSRVKLFAAPPSFQHHMQQLCFQRRSMAHRQLWPEMLREIRYPYLDRDLLEFSYAIPQEQLVGLGQRRFLMKRSLLGIVPSEILNRKRRNSAGEQPSEDILNEWPRSAEIGHDVKSSALGFVDRQLLVEALEKVWRKEEVPVESLKRTIFLESWLRHLTVRKILTMPSSPTTRAKCSSMETNKVQVRPKTSAS